MPQSEETRIAVVVDDDPLIRRIVVAGLEPFGFTRILEADDGEPARRLLEQHEVDVVVTDLVMPVLDGLTLMRWAQEHRPGPVWIILSGVDTFDAAVDAIHLGAFDFLAKPPHVKELEVSVRNALAQRKLVRDKEQLMQELHKSSVELLRKVNELERSSDVITKDLERAEIIQRALLPMRPPAIEGLCVDALYRPGKNVGGDLYDLVALDENQVGLHVADATGHGVSAAMLSVLFKQRLELLQQGRVLTPAEVLARVNRRISRDVRAPGQFLTAVYCLLDTRTRELTVASAGHTPLVHWHVNGETTLIERTGPALGLSADATFEERQIALEPGDRLLLYTDGLLDGCPTEGGGARIIAQVDPVLGDEALDGQERLARLYAQALGRLDERGLGADRDDITLLLVEAGSGPSRFDNAASEPERAASAHESPASACPAEPVVFAAESPDMTYLAVQGRGTWSHCDAFFRCAQEALGAGRKLEIDLSRCNHLDSTFLGTIHELVCRESGDVRVCAPPPSVRELFDELCMAQVLTATQPQPARPPVEPTPVEPTKPNTREAQLRLLRAHETLAALSDSNRAKFLAMVEALRAELGDGVAIPSGD